MTEFAEINTQTYEVIRVILAESKIWCEYKLQGIWVETYRDKEGKNNGGIGYTYHPDKDNFSSPQPYPSWTLNNQCIWKAPLPIKSQLVGLYVPSFILPFLNNWIPSLLNSLLFIFLQYCRARNR